MDVHTRDSAVTKRSETASFSGDAEFTGYDLCATCTGNETCTFRNGSNGPVMHCAEFKPFPSRPVNEATAAPKVRASVAQEYSGLCRNCDLREECVYVDRDKVILHCEEYR